MSCIPNSTWWLKQTFFKKCSYHVRFCFRTHLKGAVRKLQLVIPSAIIHFSPELLANYKNQRSAYLHYKPRALLIEAWAPSALLVTHWYLIESLCEHGARYFLHPYENTFEHSVQVCVLIIKSYFNEWAQKHLLFLLISDCFCSCYTLLLYCRCCVGLQLLCCKAINSKTSPQGLKKKVMIIFHRFLTFYRPADLLINWKNNQQFNQ